jgi:hypothetical protein
MNNRKCGTGNEQLIGWVRVSKQSQLIGTKEQFDYQEINHAC